MSQECRGGEGGNSWHNSISSRSFCQFRAVTLFPSLAANDKRLRVNFTPTHDYNGLGRVAQKNKIGGVDLYLIEIRIELLTKQFELRVPKGYY